MGKYDQNKLKENPQLAKARHSHYLSKDKFPHTKELFVQSKVFNVYQFNILNYHIFMRKVRT